MRRTPVPTLGKRLGKYELVDRLATGGMADVFLARAAGIGGFEKQVVCKCILPTHAADDDFVQMFLDEARLAATLHHPNIAQVFDIGRHGPLCFFTMEYVDGADLRDLLHAARPGGGVPLEQALFIVQGVAAGLHYAHEKCDAQDRPLRMVHRDVSPSNVLVSFDGAVKIADFGIAKTAMQWARTRTGQIKGKAAFMSPEQCRGEALDRRSDVFAIGVLLYELTTGVAPFQADSEYATIRRIVEEDAAPPASHRPDYPPALATIVMRALGRSPDDRYATAQELQVDLETFAREQNLVVSPIELARYMDGLFGGQRPRATVAATEATAETTTVGARTPSSLRGLRGGWRRPTVLVAAGVALVALLAGGFGLARHQGSIVQAPAAAEAPAAILAPPRPAPPVKSVPVAAAEAPEVVAGAAQTPALATRPVHRAAKARARHKAVAAVRSSKTHTGEADLDAPFPR